MYRFELYVLRLDFTDISNRVNLNYLMLKYNLEVFIHYFLKEYNVIDEHIITD